jgi:hypothetical protein
MKQGWSMRGGGWGEYGRLVIMVLNSFDQHQKAELLIKKNGQGRFPARSPGESRGHWGIEVMLLLLHQASHLLHLVVHTIHP